MVAISVSPVYWTVRLGEDHSDHWRVRSDRKRQIRAAMAKAVRRVRFRNRSEADAECRILNELLVRAVPELSGTPYRYVVDEEFGMSL